MNHYHTVEQKGEAEFRDKGSRFIGLVFPITSFEELKVQLEKIRKEHPKAVHYCYAYRLGTDGNQYRSNDDGEPSGTAGKPILGQIDSKALTDIAVVVVRYFGGILLGVSGLIQAYKTTAALAIQMVPMVKKPLMDEYVIDCAPEQIHSVYQLVKQSGGRVGHKEELLFSRTYVQIPREFVPDFLERMRDKYHVTCKKNS